MSRKKFWILTIFILLIISACIGVWITQNMEQKTVFMSEPVELPDDTSLPDSKTISQPTFEKELEQTFVKDEVFERLTQNIKVQQLEIATHEEEIKINDLISEMSLEEKVAQLFFITPEALTGVSPVTSTGEITREAFQNYPVGGIVYFASNLKTPDQTKKMLNNISDYSMEIIQLPIFLGIDEEGGRVLRVGKQEAFGVEKVEAMGALAKNKDPNLIYEAGNTIGTYLKELGFNTDFAPDADVITNPQNEVIGDRSFGKDAQEVADMACAFSRGLHDAGILASYKHFPGHGGTEADSHLGYAYSYRTLEELKREELVPFQSGSDNGVEFIMVSHISTPAVTDNDIPASLSKFWVTDILRNEIGYEGIIITDSMSMGAVSEHYTSSEATMLAVQAGCDMILMPEDFKSSYASLLKAVEDGVISEERIEESVSRIIKAKFVLLNMDYEKEKNLDQ